MKTKLCFGGVCFTFRINYTLNNFTEDFRYGDVESILRFSLLGIARKVDQSSGILPS